MKYAQLIKAIDSTSQKLLGHAATVTNQTLVVRNWFIGAYILEYEQSGDDRAQYGARLIESLSRDLVRRNVNGISPTNLRLFREFYRAYPHLGQGLPDPLPQMLGGPIQQTLSVESAPAPSKLTRIQRTPSVESPERRLFLSPELLLRFSWSKIIELLRLDDPLKRAFYENECLKGNWSVRQLQRQIGSLLYERTGLSRDKTAVLRRADRQEPKEHIEELIRDPYVLEFTGLAELPRYRENDLEKALLDHLQQFLLELGTGFCFEARQFRVTVGNEHDYVDLVFYHRVLRCHVLVDLKIRAFRHADAGQMNYYLNFFRKCVMREGDNPPVGILLCSDRENTKVEFATSAMDNKVFVARYLVALPSPEELRTFLEKDRAQIEGLMLQTNRPTKCRRKLQQKRSGQGL
ncbi:MAG: DUF1016 domain-containing protein [Verrucomicrobia bacterium]|nr:DUF1016 domain-containing protein [Verrucomicrobiota bacterium]